MNYSKRGLGKQICEHPLRVLSPQLKQEANSKNSLNDIYPQTSGGSMRNLHTSEQALKPVSKNIPLKFKMLKVYRTYIDQNFPSRNSFMYNQDLEAKIIGLVDQLRVLKMKNRILREKANSYSYLKLRLKKYPQKNNEAKRVKQCGNDPLEHIMGELRNGIFRMCNSSK